MNKWLRLLREFLQDMAGPPVDIKNNDIGIVPMKVYVWRCVGCGERIEQKEKPEKCPNCGDTDFRKVPQPPMIIIR